MLERIRLLNFQKHRDLKIRFDPRVTTIVGTSDAGKSSVLRALRWVTRNKPSGDAFVRDGEGQCSVSLWLDDQRITRIKGKGVNEIRVGGKKNGLIPETPCQIGVFEAFGSELPEPVERLCNLGEVNFQQQHDSPFWFSLSAGQVSKELNTVVNLDVMDRTLANVASALRKARSVADVCSNRVREVEEKQKELEWVPEMVDAHDIMEVLERKSLEVKGKVDETRKILDEAEVLEKEACLEIPDLTELQRSREEKEELTEQVRKWKNVLNDVEVAEEEVLTEIPDLVELQRCRDIYVESSNKAKVWKDLLFEVEYQQEGVEDLRDGVRKIEEELKEEFGDVCPLCGSSMGGE